MNLAILDSELFLVFIDLYTKISMFSLKIQNLNQKIKEISGSYRGILSTNKKNLINIVLLEKSVIVSLQILYI